MRRVFPIVLLLAACSEPGFAPSPPDGEGHVVTVPVQGAVYDSLTRAPVAGVLVAIQQQFFPTDDGGRYQALVPVGTTTISVSAPGYERFSRIIDVEPGRDFDLPLRRLAPYPTSCEYSPEGFSAIVIDLQGRKSLERWTQSTLTLVTPTTTRTIGAIDWGYTPLDTYRWQVTIDDADSATTRVDWKLFDSEGDLYSGSCEPVHVSADSTLL